MKNAPAHGTPVECTPSRRRYRSPHGNFPPRRKEDAEMNETFFYENGLRFTCTRCSLCCTRDEGYVFLTDPDVERLFRALSMKRGEFVDVYCRWVEFGGGRKLLSLKEKLNNDCIFWKDGCTVYGARPLQCRSYPFWKNFLSSKERWEECTRDCAGAGHGALHTKEEIEAWIAQEDGEALISGGRQMSESSLK
jgi:Fe-S-cluster containining protein